MSTLYTPEIADIICARIGEGQSVKRAIKGIGYPTIAEFYAWLRESEEFRRQYWTARAAAADALVEEMLDLCDECEEDKDCVGKARLQIDTRKWIAAKLQPAKYGDRLDLSGNLTHQHYERVPVPGITRESDSLAAAAGPPNTRH